MTDFDMNAFTARADKDSAPTGSYGLVYETWQNEKSNNALTLIRADVPQALQAEAEAALRASGIIQDTWEPEDGTCVHGLDEMTCPCGCFEHDDHFYDHQNALSDEEIVELNQMELDDLLASMHPVARMVHHIKLAFAKGLRKQKIK